MKKLILAIAISMSIGIFTYAQINYSPVSTNNVSSEVIPNPFRIVTLDELNEKVRTAITEHKSVFSIKMITYDENLKLTLVTFEDQDTEFEKVLILNDNGEEI